MRRFSSVNKLRLKWILSSQKLKIHIFVDVIYILDTWLSEFGIETISTNLFYNLYITVVRWTLGIIVEGQRSFVVVAVFVLQGTCVYQPPTCAIATFFRCHRPCYQVQPYTVVWTVEKVPKSRKSMKKYKIWKAQVTGDSRKPFYVRNCHDTPK